MRAAKKRRPMGALAASVSLALVPLAAPLPAATTTTTPADAPKPTAQVSPSTAAIGTTVEVTGTAFAPQQLFNVTVCGAGGSGTSTTCAFTDGVQMASEADGSLLGQIVVTAPPVACPCSVRISPLDRVGDAVLAPLTITDMPADVAPAPPTPAAPSLTVNQTTIRVDDTWLAYIGGSSKRTVLVEVSNNGAVGVEPAAIEVRAGPPGDVTQFVKGPLPPTIGPGQTVTISIPVAFPSLSTGAQLVQGRIITAFGDTAFEARTSISWWTAWVVPAVVGFELFLLVLWFVLRRLRSKPAAEPS